MRQPQEEVDAWGISIADTTAEAKAAEQPAAAGRIRCRRLDSPIGSGRKPLKANSFLWLEPPRQQRALG